MATMFGTADEVRRLLREGHDPNEIGPAGQSLLLAAVWNDRPLATIEALLEAGADPNFADGIGNTVMGVAADRACMRANDEALATRQAREPDWTIVLTLERAGRRDDAQDIASAYDRRLPAA